MSVRLTLKRAKSRSGGSRTVFDFMGCACYYSPHAV